VLLKSADEFLLCQEISMIKSLAVAALVTIGWCALTPARADEWDKKTILTVGEPIQLPGAVLQPGKYVMKLMDSQSDRHIVQVFNEDQSHLITTILAIPNYRLEPTGKTAFQWWETPAGQPRALRAWFYPGDNFGQEFAYPKNMSVQIASNNQQSVPTVTNNKVTEVDKSGTEGALGEEHNKPVEQPAQVAQNTPPPAPAATPEPAPAPVTDQGTRARTELPKTGSAFPLIALGGFLALAAGVLLRFANRVA
jgi:LPXTG-motif cell wall-anchored protein